MLGAGIVAVIAFYLIGVNSGAVMTLSSSGFYVDDGDIRTSGDVGFSTSATSELSVSLRNITDILKEISVSLERTVNFTTTPEMTTLALVQEGIITAYKFTNLSCDAECRIDPDVEFKFGSGFTAAADWCYTSGGHGCALGEMCNANGNCEIVPTVRYVMFVSKTTFNSSSTFPEMHSSCSIEGAAGTATGALALSSSSWFALTPDAFLGFTLSGIIDALLPGLDGALDKTNGLVSATMMTSTLEKIGLFYPTDGGNTPNFMDTPLTVMLRDADGAAVTSQTAWGGIISVLYPYNVALDTCWNGRPDFPITQDLSFPLAPWWMRDAIVSCSQLHPILCIGRLDASPV